MTVAEFIEWLKSQDQQAEVRCLVNYPGTGYYDQGGECGIEPFVPELSDKNYTGQDDRYLLIGEIK